MAAVHVELADGGGSYRRACTHPCRARCSAIPSVSPDLHACDMILHSKA